MQGLEKFFNYAVGDGDMKMPQTTTKQVTFTYVGIEM